MSNLSKNEIKVVNSIFASETATRQVVAREAQLSLVKISAILKTLEQNGYVGKAGQTQGRSGRPSELYHLKPELGYAVGISLLTDSFTITSVDCDKNICHEEVHPLSISSNPDRHAQNIVDQVSDALSGFVKNHFSSKDVVLAVGLALPGLVDSQRGIWLQGLQMTGINHIRIGEILSAKIGIPVYIEDCSRAITYFEKTKGLGRGMENFVLVYLGLGMGTGIIINNQLYRGYHGIAGEIGHIVHANNSYRCSCNNVGCLETVISTIGILRIFRDRLQEGVLSSLQQITAKELSLSDIFEAAESGDRVTQATLREIGNYLGDACAILIKLFNPQNIIISGQGAIFGNLFIESIQQVVQQRVIPEMLTDSSIQFADYESNQEAAGCALIALEHFLRDRLDTLTGDKHD